VLPFTERYLSWVRYVPTAWTVSLLGQAAEQQVQEHFGGLFSMMNPHDDAHIIGQLLNVNIHTYLPDDLLVKTDRSSMAASLEARSPFLDHQLVHYASAIPSSLKVKNGVSKYILKKALRGVVPDAIIDRKKHGFGVPVGAWFRGDLSGYLDSVLLGDRAAHRGIFEHETVQDMIGVHKSGKTDLGHALWTLLTFELWMQRNFD
jgi:asparagine synthase (glutamine-hydrolysing)